MYKGLRVHLLLEEDVQADMYNWYAK